MWIDSGQLLLRNTHVGILVDTKDAWPPAGRLSLGGFAFDHIGGFHGETSDFTPNRDGVLPSIGMKKSSRC
jgi:hypothetical protein